MTEDSNFVLPKHNLEEECCEEYEEEIVDGEVVQHDIVPTQTSVPVAKQNVDYCTRQGIDFIKDLTKSARITAVYDEKGSKKLSISAPKTAWVHNFIYLNGEKFDFYGREYLNPIYNSPNKEILLKTGRQVEKSTLLANNMAIMCCLQPYFRCLYVSPSHVQTRTFSNDKLKPILERSPLIKRYLQDNKVSNQVFEKGFTNGAFIFLRSAFLSADRSRGISSDLLCLDEIQDIIMGNIPVIAQCLSHSKHAISVYAGTPKTFNNTIEQFWANSSQSEWMVKCRGCNKWNFLDIKNVGKRCPICKYCGKDLDITNGQWQSAQSGKRMIGYRIPQLMVPWIVKKDGESWSKLVSEMETYSECQFFNEVLGLSYDNAAKPITRADVLLNCDPSHHFIGDPLHLSEGEIYEFKKKTLFAGVDWGEGNDGAGKDMMGKIRTASYTVLTIGGMVGNKFKVYYCKRYMGREIDPDFIVKDIVRKCKRLGVKMIGVDWGHGWGVNNKLFRTFGPERCVQFMYVDNQKEVRKWDPIGYKFQLMRNHVMSELFFTVKEQNFIFPPLDEWEEFAKDMFSISVEYVEYQRKLRYIHRQSDPDDWFHSLLYAQQASKIYYGKY